MKTLRKLIALLVVTSMLLSNYGFSVLADDVEGIESTEEISGFNETAHGEVIEEGECGENAKYKLYEDEMLYIYGTGETEKSGYFSSKFILNVFIEDGIETIGYKMFSGCKDAKEIRMPNGLNDIGIEAFSGCRNLSKITIPEGVKEIKDRTFSGCKELSEVKMSKDIFSIGESAFASCNKLKTISISEKTKTIGSCAFNGCTEMVGIILPDGLEAIESSAFSYSGLKSIIIPKGVTTIEDYAFGGCFYLEKAIIPNTVKRIRDDAFDRCGRDSGMFIIYCDNDSEAERYAKENEITCMPYDMWNHEHSYTEEIPANEHKEAIDRAIAPTETKEGKTEGSHCEICGEILKAQETIPSTGKVENPNESAEPDDTEKPDTSKQPEVQVENTFNGCKGSPVKLSISCSENDDFTFECMDDCGVASKYSGYSSVSIGAFSSYSKNYELTFQTSGEHIISVYKNGDLAENDKVVVEENHTWDSGKIEKKADCTKNGSKKFTCLNCKNTYTESIQATGHNYKEIITRKETCTFDGTKTLSCLNCAESYTEKIPKTGHDFSDWYISKKPTIFKSGVQTRKCNRCGENKNQTIEKLKSSVSIKKKVSTKKGKTVTLKIIKKSKGDKVKSWKSSNKKIATINSKGEITAKKKGKTNITVTMKSGCKAICKVTVK